jgi:hypothetical protein
MRGAILPFPQYAFMAWCSVKKSTGSTLLFTLYTADEVVRCTRCNVCTKSSGRSQPFANKEHSDFRHLGECGKLHHTEIGLENAALWCDYGVLFGKGFIL